MGVGAITAVRALVAPAKEYLWELVIPQVPEASGDASLALTLRARSTVLPGNGVLKVSSHFKGHRIQHPSKRNFPGTIPMRFEEGLNAEVLKVINDWNRAWLDEKTGEGKGEDAFKTNALLRVLDHADAVVTTVHLYGVFPETVPDVPLSYESPNLLNIEVVFSYDYWDLE